MDRGLATASAADNWRSRRRWRSDEGFLTLEFVSVGFFVLLAFLLLVNVILMQFTSGALRNALDHGARHGAAEENDDRDCEAAAVSRLHDLVPDQRDRPTIAIRCELDEESGLMIARASGSLASALPFDGGFFEWTIDTTVYATKEDL